MGAEQYDVVVVGSGVAGGHVASRCRKAGLSVALVERDGFGGTCPLRGCEPKKVLADAAATRERLGNSLGQGLTGGADIDWPALAELKDSFMDGLSDRIRGVHEGLGTEIVRGEAAFSGPDTVRVGQRELQGRRILIGAGAQPRPLDFPGAELMATSTDFLELAELPARMAFVGGGFISFESAHVAHQAGARAVIVNRSERVLRRFDADLVQRLVEHLRETGLEVETGLPPESIERTPGGLVLRAGGREFEADMVVHGAGRIPAVQGLNLEAAGVPLEHGAVAVARTMRSTGNPAVYAAGDVCSLGMALTPVGAYQAEVAARNILRDLGKDQGPEALADDDVAPYALFTYPPLAGVGLLEEEARKRGLDVEVVKGDAARWPEYGRIGQDCAGYKLILDKKTGTLLGAHVLGDAAEETVNFLAQVMRSGRPLRKAAFLPLAYPSFGYAVRYMLR